MPPLQSREFAMNMSTTLVLALAAIVAASACARSGRGAPPPASGSIAPVPSSGVSPSRPPTGPMPAAPQMTSAPITVQDLNRQDALGGAGTSFFFAGRPPGSTGIIFGYDEHHATGIWIDHRLVPLKSAGTKELAPATGDYGLGERTLETWVGEGVEVTFDVRTTSAGEGGNALRGLMVVTMGARRTSFPIEGGRWC
jgi:hypothetical protein